MTSFDPLTRDSDTRAIDLSTEGMPGAVPSVPSRLLAERELADILESLEKHPTTAAYFDAARQIDSLRNHLRPVRVAMLATFTVDLLLPFLKVEAARQGFSVDVYVGPFNNTHQELLNPTSGCVRHQPDVVFLSQLLEDVCPALARDFLVLDQRETEHYIEETTANLVGALEAFRRSSHASVVVQNFAAPPSPLLGIFEAMAESSQTEAIHRLNRRLAEALRNIRGTYLLDYNAATAYVGYRHWYDDKMLHLARSPISAQALPVLARRQSIFLRALLTPPKKCLVVDLDNTLWGGVIAESGINGIQLGPTYPGNVYRSFQSFLVQLYRRGVLLAISSKNNAADVDEVFRNHPHMVLKREHIASMRVNWRPKPENVAEIAAELGLGLESLAFFDDSPAECAEMRQFLPQVLTIQAPKDATKFRQAVIDGGAFERLSVTEEDRRRGQMYQEQRLRTLELQSATSLEAFLTGLQMTAIVRAVDQFSFPRVLDLLQKTNQFNLTTRRYSAAELSAVIADPSQVAFSVQLTDRFGDNGIVGVAIVRLGHPVARIDSFLLSCRVIGRGVETALLAFVADWARGRGMTTLEGEFIRTSKNAPAADFYARHAFTPLDGNGNGNGSLHQCNRWTLDLTTTRCEWPSYIRRVTTDDDR